MRHHLVKVHGLRCVVITEKAVHLCLLCSGNYRKASATWSLAQILGFLTGTS
jgi:hypothetical protein